MFPIFEQFDYSGSNKRGPLRAYDHHVTSPGSPGFITGHASIQTTVDICGHLVPSSNRNAVNVLDDPAEPRLNVVPASAG